MEASRQFASHDPRLISILEILGSYFVDVFYNHVYNSSQTRLKAGASLTDEYVRHVQSYIIGVKNDEGCYREVVQNLHKYFQTTTRYTTLSFADFVERIVKQFIPEEYYDLLKSPEKDESLGSIVADLSSALGAYVTSPDMLRRIIDGHNHQPRVTIRMVQDQAVTVLLAKRGEIHNNFLRRIGQAKDTVSMDVVDDLKKAIRKLVKQKADLKIQLGEAEERVMALEDDVDVLKKKDGKYRKLIALMQNEREQGLQGAAFSATVPTRDYRAEADPLEFVARGGLAPPRADRIAEDRDDPGPRGAGFFADAPPEAYGGLSPQMDLVTPTPPRRRTANLATMMTASLAADEDGEDGGSGGSGSDGGSGGSGSGDGGGQ
jgi:uncharacterized membrane protein YgcG